MRAIEVGGINTDTLATSVLRPESGQSTDPALPHCATGGVCRMSIK